MSGVPFVHSQMGDAKDCSPKKILKCDMDLKLGDAKECSPCQTFNNFDDITECQ